MQVPVNWRFRFVLAVVSLLIVAAVYSSVGYLRSRVPVPTAALQPFSGFVQDDQGNPLPGVTITAPSLSIPSQETDLKGGFAFQVDLPVGTNFRVIIQKPGFKTHTADPPAGDKTFNIILEKESP